MVGLTPELFHQPGSGIDVSGSDGVLQRFLGQVVAEAPAIMVQALDVEHVGQLGVQADSTPALLGFHINAGGHLLARAVITPWAEIPAA
jgi:hypothetical protein